MVKTAQSEGRQEKANMLETDKNLINSSTEKTNIKFMLSGIRWKLAYETVSTLQYELSIDF